MQPIRHALTVDDAPCIAESGVVSNPAVMDAFRETLKAHGVTHCVAFVVGRTAVGHEAMLERWLADGYELGNHTYDHPRASRVDPKAFVASIKRCHELLSAVGAFQARRSAWFRFPYLSRGDGPAPRAEIHAACEDLGYRIAHASVNLHDDRFDPRFDRATRRGAEAEAAVIAQRYEDVALASVRHAVRRMEQALSRVPPLISYCHFGPISTHRIGVVLNRLRAAGAELCPLEDAMADGIYTGFDRDHSLDGLVTDTLPRARWIGARRTLVRWSERLGLAGQDRYGPRWPYLH